MRQLLFALALLTPTAVSAQATRPSEAAVARHTATIPAGVSVRKQAGAFYYADARGMTLYALDQRVASGRTGTPDYCVGPCTRVWTPLAARAETQPIGDWAVRQGANGPQWAFKGKPVFTYNGDHAPGDMAGDAYEDLWSVIEHIPPAPVLIAPASVVATYRKGGYVLNDRAGHGLFTAVATCAAACGAWTPFVAGMAARDIGNWTVIRGDVRAQWAYRGKPVFVSENDAATSIPTGAEVLVP